MSKSILQAVLILFATPLLRAQKNISMPFEVSGGLMLVQARVDGRAGYFVLDTGVEHLVLNQAYFSGLPSKKVFHHLLGSRRGGAYRYVRFELGVGFAKKVYADIVDMRAIERGRGCPIHGLIGMHVLRAFETLYVDRKRQRLVLASGRGRSAGRGVNTAVPRDTVAFTWKGYLPVIRLYLEEQPLRVALDTGAEMNLISDQEKDLLLVFRSDPGRQVALRGFGPRMARRGFGKVAGLQVGDRPCPTLHFAFAYLARFNRLLQGKPLSGIIHPKALGAMQWAIAFRKREIYLWGAYPKKTTPAFAFLKTFEGGN